jgi:tetratricopeptide (TPR) repeat protein
MREFYELLGLSENATDEEITNRFNELREKYREERWQDGEAGNEAARMLTKLEVAYNEIMSSRKEQEKNTEGQNSFEEITALLKENKIAEAQARLDDFNERTAEWHYLQAVVYYKKNWMNDSKKQLEIAIEMDPSNQKYRAAYGKLNARNEQQQQQQYQQTQNPYNRGSSYDEPQQMGGGNACSECISCCYTYLCIDCLYTMCCGCR